MDGKDQFAEQQEAPKQQPDAQGGSSGKQQVFQVVNPTLPSGGGAIEGMGEVFNAQEFTGTASLNIPIPETDCRGLTPALALEYSSGNGNSAFGMGWDVSIPNISTQTSKHIPRYDGEDVFILSGSDYLVPYNYTSPPDLPLNSVLTAQGYDLQSYYRPRSESSFSIIQRWQKPADASATLWVVVDKDNSTRIFGADATARVFNPADNRQIFTWYLQEMYDSKGNHIIFEYKKEDGAGVTGSLRDSSTQTYLTKAKYGNDQPIEGSILFPDAGAPVIIPDWHFYVVFDYGGYDIEVSNNNPFVPTGEWSVRQDPFSSYIAGFEIRTYRLCQNVLLFHDFEQLNPDHPALIKALRLLYDESPVLSLLESADVVGYKYIGDTAPSYSTKPMPPLELFYSKFPPAESQYQVLDYQQFQQEDGTPIPALTQDAQFSFADLEAQGIPGILYSDGNTVYYREPVSLDNNNVQYSDWKEMDFPFPRLVNMGDYTLMDINANGRLDLVNTKTYQAGFNEQQAYNVWTDFEAFEQFPTDYNDPFQQQIDVEGTGVSDVLKVEQEHVKYYPSLMNKGFGSAKEVTRPDFLPTSRISAEQVMYTWNNMIGSGLSQYIEITQNSITCWPSLGYANFSEPITVGNVPTFGENFDTKRVRLTDLDGSGFADLIYINNDSIDIYQNQSGNSLADKISITLPEPWDNLDQIQFADVNGMGAQCLIFTKTHPEPQQWYYDFNRIKVTSGTAEYRSQKPYLLTGTVNNMGAATNLEYTGSAAFYLKDKADGLDWITNMPNVVQVLSKVITSDEISQTLLTTTYDYHHGYYDWHDRTFRGFGRVDATNSETFKDFDPANPGSGGAAYEQPPTIVKTWYFNGADQEQTDELLAYYKANEYWQEDSEAPDIVPYDIVYQTGGDTERNVINAFRTLAGSYIHKETFGNDGTPWADNPYTVEEAQYRATQLQKAGTNEYAVFMPISIQSFELNYERSIDDPMATQELSTNIDEWGNVLESLNIAYCRRTGNIPAEMDKQMALQQGATYITYTETQYINTPDTMPLADFYLLGQVYDERAYQLTNLVLHPGQLYYDWNDVGTIDTTDQTTLNWQQDFFFDADNSTALPLGEITAQALPYRSASAAFNKAKLEAEYTGVLDSTALDDLLTDSSQEGYGGYVNQSGSGDEDLFYWNGGSYLNYQTAFYLPTDNYDVFGNKTAYVWDEYNLLIYKVTNPANSVTEITVIDYQSLSPQQIKDINGNYGEVLMDELNMVVATSLYGTEGGDSVGFDPLSGYTAPVGTTFADLTANDADLQPYLQNAATFFYYDLLAWMGLVDEGALQSIGANGQTLISELVDAGYITPEGAIKEKFRRIETAANLELPNLSEEDKEIVFQLLTEATNQMPTNSVKLTAEQYPADDPDDKAAKVAVAFSDGSGRSLETKLKLTDKGDAFVVTEDGSLAMVEDVEIRWLTSGAVRYNNQGKVIQKFEPYYIETADYSDYEYGVSALMYYDALDRVILTEFPRNEDDNGDQVGVFSKELTGSLMSGEAPLPASDFTEPVSITMYSTLQQKFVPNPWSLLSFDTNETVVDSSYYKAAKAGDISGLSPHELTSLDKAAVFYNYYHFSYFDSAAREIQSGYDDASTIDISHVAGSDLLIQLDIYGNHLVTIDERINGATVATFEQAPLSLSSADAQTLFDGLQSPPAGTLDAPVLNSSAGIASYYDPTDATFLAALSSLLTTINVAVGQEDDVIEVLNTQLTRYNEKDSFNLVQQVSTKNSVDSGLAWILLNAVENPLYAYDGRMVETRPYYDTLHRVTETHVAYKGTDTNDPLYGLDQYVDKVVYGEDLNSISGGSFDPKYWNLLGKGVFTLDQSGLKIGWFNNIIDLPYANAFRPKKDGKSEANWDTITDSDWNDLIGDIALCADKSLYELSITAPQLKALLATENYAGKNTYDAIGRSMSMMDPDQNLNTQTWDEADRLHSLTITPNLQITGSAEAPGITKIVYDAKGQRTLMEYKNQVQVRHTYDHYTYWLHNTKSLSQAGTETLQDLTYFYDPEGNVTYVKDNATEPVFTNNQQINGDKDYIYDALYRLIQASGREQQGLSSTNKQYGTAPPLTSTNFSINDTNGLENFIQYFSYDTGSNLIETKHTVTTNSANNWTRTNTIDSNSNRIASSTFSNDQAYVFNADANGNMLNLSNLQGLAWDYRNQLQMAVMVARTGASPNDAEYYTYGGDGMRSLKLTERYANGLQTGNYDETIYVGNFEIHNNGTLSAAGAKTGVDESWKSIRYDDGNGNTIVWQYWTIKNGQAVSNDELQRYQLTDKLGSTTMEVDSNGDMLSFEEYYAFGGTCILAGNNQVQVGSKIFKQYRYNGKERDANTGLYYFGLRYYCCWLGRWMNPDPEGMIDGPNVYAYVSNNPVTVKDHLGTNGNKNKRKRRDDSNAIMSDVRFLDPAEYEAALGMANEVFYEAHANPALFDDESARFSPALEAKLVGFFQKFAGAFAMINETLAGAIDEAGGYDEDQATDQKDSYRYFRSGAGKYNDQFAAAFPEIELNPSPGEKIKNPELHHLRYKAMFPKAAMTTFNFFLATRGSSRSGLLGTHEMMHLITSGNDSTIYKKAIAGVSGIIKRVAHQISGAPLHFVSGAPYTVSSSAPTTDSRSKSVRIQLDAAKKREKAGNGPPDYFVPVAGSALAKAKKPPGVSKKTREKFAI